MTMRYNPPPNWPQPPAGWTPPPGWEPDPSWGPAPHGWPLWVDDAPGKGGGGIPRWLKITGAVVGVLVIIGVIGSLGDDTEPSASPGATPTVSEPEPTEKAVEKPKPTKAKPAAPGVGDKVRDGKFEFTVVKVQRGVKTVGESFLEDDAQGVFTLVTVKVENIGDEGQTFSDVAQKAYDAKEREFTTDTGAGISIEDNKAFLEEINPGNTVEGVLVFDAPKGVKLTVLELHDSLFSGGVKVDLG